MDFDVNNVTLQNTSLHRANTKDEPVVHVVTHVFSALCTLWTISANCVIIGCFFRARKRPWSIFSRLTCSMCIGDLMVGIATIPFSTVLHKSRLANGIVCFFTIYFYFSFQIVTLYHVLGICIFRCFKLKHVSDQIDETKYKFHTNVIIGISWASALIVVFIPFIIWNETSNSVMLCFFPNVFGSHFGDAAVFLALTFFIPQLLTNVIYAITCYQFWRSRRISPMQNDGAAGPVLSTSRQTTDRYKVFYAASAQKQTTVTIIGTTTPGPFTTVDTREDQKMQLLDLSGKREGQTKQSVEPLDKACQEIPSTSTKQTEEPKTVNSQQTMSVNLNQNNTQTRLSQLRMKSQKQLLVTIGILLTLFNILTLPTTFTVFAMPSTETSVDFKVLISNLFVINSGLNAIVYATRVKSLRNDVKALLRKCVRVVCGCISHGN